MIRRLLIFFLWPVLDRLAPPVATSYRPPDDPHYYTIDLTHEERRRVIQGLYKTPPGTARKELIDWVETAPRAEGPKPERVNWDAEDAERRRRGSDWGEFAWDGEGK